MRLMLIPATWAFKAPSAGDLNAAVTCAVVALAQASTYGLMAFGALGATHAGAAVQAGFVTIIVAGLVSALVGRAPIAGASVRASTTLVFAALAAQLAGDPQLQALGQDRVAAVLFLCACSLALSGLFQIGFGLARLGGAAKFIPYPVVAGFMMGIAIMIVGAQIPYLIGASGSIKSVPLTDVLKQALAGPLLIGLLTAGVVWYCLPRFKWIPAALIALAFATALHHLAALLLPGFELGRLVGPVESSLPAPDALSPLLASRWRELLLTFYQPVLVSAVALAAIGSMDSLLGAAGADAAHNTRHVPNRELVGLGMGNITSALFGGIPIMFSPSTAITAYKAGARTRWSGAITPFVLALLFFLGGPLLAHAPLAGLAGIMLTVAWSLVDGWTRGLLRDLVRGALPRQGRVSALVVLAVCFVTVAFHFAYAVLFGLLMSMALFIVSMSRSLVRRSWTGAHRHSRRVYPDGHTRRLHAQGDAILILELEGALFFGSAVGLAKEVEARAGTARYVILDMRQVSSIDATGAKMLEQLAQRLAQAGIRLFLAHVTAGGRLGPQLTGFGAYPKRTAADWFKDVDTALEAAEQGILAPGAVAGSQAVIALADMDLFSGLRPDQLERVGVHLERIEVEPGAVLFSEGEPGDRLYVLERGCITICVGSGATAQRLATYEPGIVFGEVAMLDGAARSATAVADRTTVAYSLSRAALERVLEEDPSSGNRLLLHIGRHLANRLRIATDSLRAASDAGG